MQRVCRGAVILTAVSCLPLFTANVYSPFSGRWDLTIVTPKGAYPSWMEFADEGRAPAIRIVGRTGSVHPVHGIRIDGTRLTFADGAARWQIDVKDRKLTGQTPDGQLKGEPAPPLERKSPEAWTSPEPLFDGRDLAGWEADNPTANHWIAENGELQNVQAGANIRTTRKFGDFKVHIEYNCPRGGNSGVYLRGRYEVQVEYEPPGKNDPFHAMGSIYGFIPPATEVAPRPGQWEGYDVTLVGRSVTVVRDGVLIIDHAEIPGITGGAIDSREGEPGPLYLQGDHSGGLKYRNITIAVPRQ
jgi:3-keto-disaccharide hydrolase